MNNYFCFYVLSHEINVKEELCNNFYLIGLAHHKKEGVYKVGKKKNMLHNIFNNPEVKTKGFIYCIYC